MASFPQYDGGYLFQVPVSLSMLIAMTKRILLVYIICSLSGDPMPQESKEHVNLLNASK